MKLLKRTNLQVVALVVVLGSAMVSTSNADVLRVSGVITEVADRVGGAAVTILDFEIPGLRQGEGLEIVSATVSWDHAGLSGHKTVRYQVFDSPGQDLRNLRPLSMGPLLETALAGEPASTGSFYPQDYRRLGKGHLSFDVLSQVRELAEVHGNHVQVIVATDDMSPGDLGSGSLSVPTLVIRYGFLGEMKATLGRSAD